VGDPTFGLYRKRPVTVEAIRWSGFNYASILAFVGDHHKAFPAKKDDRTLLIPTLEGVMEATAGDWIIHGVKGEYYPCKPDIFDLTYERVLGPEDPAYPRLNDGEAGA
jgi:hypothetical protein